MTKLDIRAALYAPLRVIVYESEKKTTHIEYDMPSLLFGQFENTGVTEVGLELDVKLRTLIAIADDANY